MVLTKMVISMFFLLSVFHKIFYKTILRKLLRRTTLIQYIGVGVLAGARCSHRLGVFWDCRIFVVSGVLGFFWGTTHHHHHHHHHYHHHHLQNPTVQQNKLAKVKASRGWSSTSSKEEARVQSGFFSTRVWNTRPCLTVVQFDFW